MQGRIQSESLILRDRKNMYTRGMIRKVSGYGAYLGEVSLNL